MKFFLLVNLFLSAATISNGTPTKVITNMVAFLNGINVTDLEKSDFELLADVIASPVLKTAKNKIISEDDTLLRYSIRVPYIKGAVKIPLGKNYTMDYFRNLITENDLNINVLPLTQLKIVLEKCDCFTDIFMVTSVQYKKYCKSLLSDILDLMEKKYINVIVTTLDELRNPRENISALYTSPRPTNISEEYVTIHKLSDGIKTDTKFTEILKRMLSNNKNEPVRNSSITIINGLAFYEHPSPSVWGFAFRVCVFLSEFNDTHRQKFMYNDQIMWIDDFSVVYSFDHDYILKIDLTAESIPGPYINILTEHCKKHEIQRKLKPASFPLKSLLKALTASLPRSVIYVMTDVPLSDFDLLPSILNLMETKSITVDISYYGNEPDPDVYLKIMKANIKVLYS